jgi:hypothetical protein
MGRHDPGAATRSKFDAIIASMAITDERKKVVNFTDKYYNTPARLVGRVDAKLEASPAGLKGKRIGVQRSTIHDRFVTETLQDSEIVRYARQEEVYLDLAAGRIDVAMGDSVAIDGGFLKKPMGKGYGFFGPAYNDPKYFGYGAGIAVRKADTDLQARFNAAIQGHPRQRGVQEDPGQVLRLRRLRRDQVTRMLHGYGASLAARRTADAVGGRGLAGHRAGAGSAGRHGQAVAPRAMAPAGAGLHHSDARGTRPGAHAARVLRRPDGRQRRVRAAGLGLHRHRPLRGRRG